MLRHVIIGNESSACYSAHFCFDPYRMDGQEWRIKKIKQSPQKNAIFLARIHDMKVIRRLSPLSAFQGIIMRIFVLSEQSICSISRLNPWIDRGSKRVIVIVPS